MTLSICQVGRTALQHPRRVQSSLRRLRKGMALDANMHVKHAGKQHCAARKARQEADELVFTMLSANANPAAQHQMLCIKETRTWLTTMPNRLNGTVLLADKFQDSLWLHLELDPLNHPDHSHCSGQRFSVGHDWQEGRSGATPPQCGCRVAPPLRTSARPCCHL
jgi:hypothetical protein